MLATSRAKQTCVENPWASRVVHISQYCGMYGTTPPNTMAHDDTHEIRVMILNSLSRPACDKWGESIKFFIGILYTSQCYNNWWNGWCIDWKGIPKVFDLKHGLTEACSLRLQMFDGKLCQWIKVLTYKKTLRKLFITSLVELFKV